MPNAINKPADTYVFPELDHYKREWIPVLADARERIASRKTVYLCNALCSASHRYKDKFKEPDEKERTDIARYQTAAEEAEAAIGTALYGYHTVTYWLRKTYPGIEYDELSYRLAWIDHIIMKCKGV